MAKLRVSIDGELSLEFTCPNYDKVRSRAVEFVGDENLLKAKCAASRESTLEFSPVDENEVWTRCAWETDFAAFFFDNTDYNVYAKVEGGCRDLHVVSRHKAEESDKKYASLERTTVRAGILNFENDVGEFDFKVAYRDAGGAARDFRFASEVLSQKLDSRKDFKTLLTDVEDRYALLAADYLRSTYHSFERKSNAKKDTPDLIWWNLFEAERERFFKAIRTILERPRQRLRRVEEYRRADQLTVMTPALENEFAENRKIPEHLYRVEYDDHSRDTPENRFVKFAIGEIGRKYKRLSDMLVASLEFSKRISDSEKAKFSGINKQFKNFLANPFFKGIGKFSGLKQMSLTLQSAPGYATIARTYAILNAAYMLFDGIKRLETKNIADLYEIWCFLKVEDIVKASCESRYGELFKAPQANHGELSGAFVKQLGTGSQSEVVFEIGEGDNKVTLAKVVYNPKVTESERRDNGLKGTIVPTALTGKKGQIPDIVLQLTRRSMNANENPVQLTYLFDAKYRIEDTYDEEDSGAMRPPQEAIDQLHRYRDSIYYAEQSVNDSLSPRDFKKEVIGGYVLFPGKCEQEITAPEDGEDDRPAYFKSIDRVNIGAIPLRPNDKKEYGHLSDFIDRLLLETPTLESALDRLNPQKGELIGDATQEAMAEAVLYGTYVDGQLPWIEDQGLYNLPKSVAEKIGILSKTDADKKKLLLLLPARGYADITRPFKIECCLREISNEELNAPPYNYFHPATRGPYYLFKICPLVKPMTNIAAKLKIVSLGKNGVCKGVLKCAADLGIETEIAPNRDAAISAADAAVVFDISSYIPTEMKNVIDAARNVRKSHQPTAMDMRWKKTRKVLSRWLRVLLGETQDRKYVLYIDGREEDPTTDLEEKSVEFLKDVLKAT